MNIVIFLIALLRPAYLVFLLHKNQLLQQQTDLEISPMKYPVLQSNRITIVHLSVLILSLPCAAWLNNACNEYKVHYLNSKDVLFECIAYRTAYIKLFLVNFQLSLPQASFFACYALFPPTLR